MKKANTKFDVDKFNLAVIRRRLAYLENKRIKSFADFNKQMTLLSNKAQYEAEIRRQNRLFSSDIRREYARRLNQRQTNGQMVDTNSAVYKAGFYIGLLITSKRARDKVFNRFKDNDWPPRYSKNRFMTAISNKGARDVFTPNSAALIETALIMKAHDAIKNQPEKASAINKQFETARDLLYQVANKDGVNKKDIQEETKLFSQDLMQIDPENKYIFADVNSNVLAPRVPLTSENYQDKLADLTTNSFDEYRKSKDKSKHQTIIENYKGKLREFKDLMAHDGVVKKIDKMSMLNVMQGYIKLTAQQRYGQNKGDKMIDTAVKYSVNHLGDAINYKDIYAFAKDNNVGDIKAQAKIIQQVQEAANNALLIGDISLVQNTLLKNSDFDNLATIKQTNKTARQINEELMDDEPKKLGSQGKTQSSKPITPKAKKKSLDVKNTSEKDPAKLMANLLVDTQLKYGNKGVKELVTLQQALRCNAKIPKANAFDTKEQISVINQLKLINKLDKDRVSDQVAKAFVSSLPKEAIYPKKQEQKLIKRSDIDKSTSKQVASVQEYNPQISLIDIKQTDPLLYCNNQHNLDKNMSMESKL